MRLPADAALIVIDAQRAIDDPAYGPRNNFGANAAIGRLLAAWRAEGLPVAHVRHDSGEPRSPYRPGTPGHAWLAEAEPLAGEPVIPKTTPDAFAGGALEALLDSFGATTLVVCGFVTPNSVETSVRAAASLGYRTFVVADACAAVDATDIRGRRWPAEDVHALSLGHMAREFAEVVPFEAALEAAAAARLRQRWKTEAARIRAQRTGGDRG